MTCADVLEILALLDAGGIDYWVDGGWGVDALVGSQTRAHHDLDLGVKLEDVARIEALLPGFRRRSEDEWPAFLLLEDERGRVVDLMITEDCDSAETRASGQIGDGR